MGNILINFSGHPLSKDAATILEKEYSEIISAPPIQFDFSCEISEQLAAIFKNFSMKFDGSIPITIIPPGQSTLAILVAGYLHGMIGHFPRICYLQMNDRGAFVPSNEFIINTQHIRASGRLFRNTIVGGDV